MRPYRYSEYITKIIKSIPDGETFRAQDIANNLKKDLKLPTEQAKTLTNIKLKRMADNKQIERFEKGVYFKSKQTPFGIIRPSINQYAIQILTKQNGKVLGYESGVSFMNRLSITTLVPKNIEITTNSYRKKLPEGCRVATKKPIIEITEGNYLYFQLLDVINNLSKTPIDAPNPEKLIKNFACMNNLDIFKLIVYARKHYNHRTLIHIIDIFIDDK